MSTGGTNSPSRKREMEAEWDRWERRSTWIALAIALMPIPIALGISWAMGSPPWRQKVPPSQFEIHEIDLIPPPEVDHPHR